MEDDHAPDAPACARPDARGLPRPALARADPRARPDGRASPPPDARADARACSNERADVLALAGDAALHEAVAAGLIAEARAVPFAEDRLALVVPGRSDAEGLE